MSTPKNFRDLLSATDLAGMVSGPVGAGHMVVCDAHGRASALRVGPTVYEFLRPSEVRCTQVGGVFEFALAALPHLAPVRAASAVAAEAQWVLNTHVVIQRLKRKRAGTLPAPDAERWSEIVACIDIERFDRDQTFSLRQAGVLVAVQESGVLVRWAGYDDEPELVPFDLAPAELAGFEAGERFDAIVQRERASWRLVEVLQATLLPPLTPERRRELVRAIERAPSTTDVCPPID